MPRPKRIFIAIYPPEEVQRELSSFREEVPVRWVSSEDLHVTLAFLGNTGDKELKLIKEAVSSIVKEFSPFEVSLDMIQYGPSKKRPPSLIWAKGQSEVLPSLVKEMENELAKRTSYKRSERPFLTHITLGRVNKSKWRRLEEREDIRRDIDISFLAQSIDIMESTLKPTGAEYSLIESFKL